MMARATVRVRARARARARRSVWVGGRDRGGHTVEGGEGGWLALGDSSDGRASTRARAMGATWAKAASEQGVARARQMAVMASGEGEGGQHEQQCGDGAARVHAVLSLWSGGGHLNCWKHVT